jgi:hypothetical protein
MEYHSDLAIMDQISAIQDESKEKPCVGTNELIDTLKEEYKEGTKVMQAKIQVCRLLLAEKKQF